MPPPPRLGLGLAASWPVSVRKTSSSVGRRTATSSTLEPRLVEPAHGLHDRAAAVLDRQRAPRALRSAAPRRPCRRAPRPPRAPCSRPARWTSSRSPPTRSLSSSAVPSAITRPWSMTAMRSASRSASSRYWVVRRTVVPSATSASIVSHSSSRLRGSRPVVGSSRKSTGGRATSAAARSSRRRMPPEYVFADAGAGVAQAEALEQLGRARLGGAAAVAVEAADHGQVLEPGEVLVDRRVLAREADAGAELRGLADHVEAGHAGRAGVGGEERGEDADRRRLARAVRPEHAEHGAGSGLEVDAVERAHVAERLDEAARPSIAGGRECIGEPSQRFRSASVLNIEETARVAETTSSRLLTLLSLLQGRRDWPGQELADRLEVSGRTVRRDVDRLRELGYPVESLTGPAGGYRLAAGTAMPPLLLDDDEAIAIAVGLRTAARASVTGIEETSVRALVKLEQVLPAHLRRRVQALGAATTTLPVRRRPDRRPAGADAAGRRLPRPRAPALRLPGARGREEPPRGRAALARQRRPPLVPRGVGLRAQGLAHVPRRPPHAPARERRASSRASCRPRTPRRSSRGRCGRGPTATRRGSRCTPRRRRCASGRRATSGPFEPLGEERCEYRTGDDNLDWLAARLTMLGVEFEVHEPPELIEHLRALAARLARAAQPA